MKTDIYNWFRDYFRRNGKTESKTVVQAAQAAGYTKGEIHDAKLTLQVKSTAVVFWEMPEEQQ